MQKMGRPLSPAYLLCALFCLLLPSPAHAQPPYNPDLMLHGTYAPGMPLPVREAGGDGQDCAFQCTGDSSCVGFNWLPSGCSVPALTLHCPGAQYPNGCCWLMTRVDALNSSASTCGGSFIMRPLPAAAHTHTTTAAAPRKNVLYILVDDMRPDVAPYGSSWMVTPHLHSLARSGVTFNRAYCNIAVCSPSRMSFLTGRYPHHTRTWNFVNHVRQATCDEVPGFIVGDEATAYRDVPIMYGGAGQCCSWCTNDTACAAWSLKPGTASCKLYSKLAASPVPAAPGVLSGARGSTAMQQEWVTLPQHFGKNGYYTLATGKIFHTEEGGNGPAPWAGDGTGMPPLQDPPSWDCTCASSSCATSGVGPGNNTMWNVNSMAPMRPCGSNCSTPGTLQGDVAPGTFRFCDRIIGDDALLKLGAAADNYDASGQPFFLAVGFRKPHLPFRHPSAYDALYPNVSSIPLARFQTLDASVPPIAYHQTPLAQNPYVPMDPTRAATLRRDYYAAISWVDWNIGRVLSELDARGLTNDTLVVFHADHGWSLGEAGEWEKFTNFEFGTRVPLIMRAPWLPAGAGTNVSSVVELVDVFPTMAELAGVPAPGTYQLDGSSLAPLVSHGEAAALHNYSLSVYPRCPADLANVSRYWENNDCVMVERAHFPFLGVSIRTDTFRYTEWAYWNATALQPQLGIAPLAVELYDHTDDTGTSFDGPFEQANLAGQPAYAAVQAQLAALLRSAYPLTTAAGGV